MSNQNVVDVRWFNGRACIGVVKVEDKYSGTKYYIGVGTGDDEQEDIDYIASWGTMVPDHIGKVMFGDV